MENEFDNSPIQDDLPDFTLAEIVEMEKSFKKMGEIIPASELCEKLAEKFSCSLHRLEKSSVRWEQVHSWFQYRKKQAEANPRANLKQLVASSPAMEDPVGISTMLYEEAIVPSHKRTSNITPEEPQLSIDESMAELTELMFEARSSKDFAWFDVASFLTYRVVHSGELEVKVRFSGFGNEEDEWVNVRKAVRKRSVPLVDLECQKVDVGDLVLCFREGDNHALYCDAHVVEIERRMHDFSGCNCIFVVRYDHDCVQDKVELNRLCCRPT